MAWYCQEKARCGSDSNRRASAWKTNAFAYRYPGHSFFEQNMRDRDKEGERENIIRPCQSCDASAIEMRTMCETIFLNKEDDTGQTRTGDLLHSKRMPLHVAWTEMRRCAEQLHFSFPVHAGIRVGKNTTSPTKGSRHVLNIETMKCNRNCIDRIRTDHLACFRTCP